MSLKVYYDFMSQPSRALIIFLKSNNIPYVDCPVALRKGEHMQDEFKQINPFQKVPCIDDNGFKLTESVAILKYLAMKYKVADNWYPKELQKQAKVDEYMNWQHFNLRTHGSMYFRTLLLTKPLNEKALERWKEGLETSLDHLEEVFLSKGQFVNGANDVTIADLLCACEIEQPMSVGYEILSKRPKIKAYMERVKSRLAPHYEDAHVVIRGLSKNFASGKL